MSRLHVFPARSIRLLAAAAVSLATVLTACSDQEPTHLAPTQPSRLTGSGAVLTVSALSFDFGEHILNVLSDPREFTLTNTGTDVLYFNAAPSHGGTNPGDFIDQQASAPACSFAQDAGLAPGASCNIAVAFWPTIAGSRSGTLDITSTGGSASISLTGYAVASGAILVVSPESLSFGQQTAGLIAPDRAIQIENFGNQDLTIDGFSVTGTNSGDFTAITPLSGACTAALKPWTYCTVLVRFAPSAVGARSAKLTVSSSAGARDVPLAGTGIAGGDVGVSLAATQSGRTLTYAIAVKNSGNEATGVFLADAIPEGTTFVDLSAPTNLDCTKPAVGGTGRITCGVGTMRGGESFSVQLSVKANAGYRGKIVDRAEVSALSLDPVSSNDSASVSTTIGKK